MVLIILVQIHIILKMKNKKKVVLLVLKKNKKDLNQILYQVLVNTIQIKLHFN